MKKLIKMWKTLSSDLSAGQRISLMAVAGMGIMIFVGFALLLVLVTVKGKAVKLNANQAVALEERNKEDVFVLPPDAVIDNVAAGDGNIILKVRIDRDEFLYFYEHGTEHPKKIITFKREK